MFDAVLFDCDGTLVDSEPMNNQAVVKTLHDVGLTQYTHEYALEYFVGRQISTIFAEVQAENNIVLPADMVKRFNQNVRDLTTTDLKLIDGVREVVAYSKAHAKHIAVVSNGEHDAVRLSVHAAGIQEFFDDGDIITGQTAARPKPAPDPFLMISDKYGIDPATCLVMEDSTVGTTAGVAAGMIVWGFVGTHHHPQAQAERLKDAGAARVFDSMHDVLAALKNL